MTKYHDRDIWRAVRDDLTRYREDLVLAFSATTYEREIALLDEIARKIAEKVEPLVETYADYPRRSQP